MKLTYEVDRGHKGQPDHTLPRAVTLLSSMSQGGLSLSSRLRLDDESPRAGAGSEEGELSSSSKP